MVNGKVGCVFGWYMVQACIKSYSRSVLGQFIVLQQLLLHLRPDTSTVIHLPSNVTPSFNGLLRVDLLPHPQAHFLFPGYEASRFAECIQKKMMRPPPPLPPRLQAN